jgi:peptidoglycan biosynthesis protein MviN/MurJ (putative lipid II flippase)
LSKLLSIITAILTLKKSGIKTSKVGWFWLFQIILTIIATRFIDKGIDFLVDIANNRWEPGTYLEGVTGLLAIIGATIFGIILILMFKGKINDGQPKDKEKNNDYYIIEVL